MSPADPGRRSEKDARPWVVVRVDGTTNHDAVIGALFAAGSQGVQEDGSAVVTHFPPGTDTTDIERLVREADPAAHIDVSDAPAVDWSQWRASVSAHRLAKVTISPPWLADPSDGMTVIIEPAMAFGTGEHATTRGVVRLMQTIPSMPEVVADLGAGSAVLGMCAAKLGARRVFAIELDHDAIGNAEENVRANALENVVHVLEGDAAVLLPLVSPVGLVLANIISSVLVEILPVVHDSLLPRGHAILSGILLDEKSRMLDHIERGGWHVVSDDAEDEWWSVLIQRPL